MNLISCKHCGVVLNRNLIFPRCYDPVTGNRLSECTAWDPDTLEWVAFVNCPVCKEPVLETDIDLGAVPGIM